MKKLLLATKKLLLRGIVLLCCIIQVLVRYSRYMGRKRIPEGTGMLFIFRKDQKLSFWMKDTPVALSIAFISSNGEIRETRDMTPFSHESVESSTPVRYALEVPQGWFKRNNVGPGSTIELPQSKLPIPTTLM